MKTKQKGTSVPTLTKAQSLIDEHVSEILMEQAFSVIFKEFEKYLNVMEKYQGVDWSVYVKQRNKERKNAETPKTFPDETFEMEGEEEKKEETKKEDVTKEEENKEENKEESKEEKT